MLFITVGCKAFIRESTGHRLVCSNGPVMLLEGTPLLDCVKLCSAHTCAMFNYKIGSCEIFDYIDDCVKQSDIDVDIYRYTLNSNI